MNNRTCSAVTYHSTTHSTGVAAHRTAPGTPSRKPPRASFRRNARSRKYIYLYLYMCSSVKTGEVSLEKLDGTGGALTFSRAYFYTCVYEIRRLSRATFIRTELSGARDGRKIRNSPTGSVVSPVTINAPLENFSTRTFYDIS